jgi:thiol-disulfide isomerase/thioredoxin
LGAGPLRSLVHRPPDQAGDLGDGGSLASFDGATGWLNSEPRTAAGLQGRVVLVDFWTYTCINWLRTLPYVRAWAEKYGDAGLTVIGVHTPEFDFERNRANVTAQAGALGVSWPVALDNDYAVWDAFDNHYWPAVYLADADGRIRYHHFGEEAYEETERAIQQLLIEAGARDIDQSLVSVEPTGLELAADWPSVQTPETYTGSSMSANFVQDGTAAYGAPADFAAPANLPGNSWALSGNWTVTERAAIANEPGARIAFQFHARDLNLVMAPPSAGTPIPFRVSLDGQPASCAHGSDVSSNATGALDAPRTYQLIRQPDSIEWRRFEIEFDQPGAAVYCFTFG